MKQKLRLFTSLLLLAVASAAWGETGTITFGNNGTKINGASVTGTDNLNNNWTITTVGTTSFTQSTSYSQVGSSKNPATSITLTTTLPESVTITAFSAKFGGFGDTAGSISLKVGDTEVGTGSLNGTNDVTVSSTPNAAGTVLTVTVTDIAKGVKVYNVSYTYTTGEVKPVCEMPTFDPAGGTAVTIGTVVTISTATEGASIIYTTDGSTPSAENGTTGNTVTINEATTINAIAVKEGCDNSGVASASYTIVKVAKPTFSPEEGDVDAGTVVTISTATEGATIYYTTDGSTPTTESTQGNSVTINANTTINAIAVKEGMANSNVATAEYVLKGESVSGYTIDFEEAASSYADWTFTNAESAQTGSITAHGGTYYGTTGGKTTASIQTKEKVASPGVFTCYVSKQSTNTTSSTWYIQVSEDGSEWTDVKTQSATSMNKGVWVEFSADLSAYSNVYVRLYYSGSTAVRNVDDISLTMASSLAAPTISLPAGSYVGTQSVTLTAEDGASIYYTLDETTPTEESTPYTDAISITESCTLKAIAVKDGVSSNVASAVYTIRIPYSTIPALFEAATATATDVDVTFGGWIVSAVSGSNAYLTDNEGHGLIIYKKNHGFNVGDVLTGTASCQLQVYKGSAELTQLTATTEGLTVTSGGSVETISNIAMSELGGVNTGALVKYEKLTYDGTALEDAQGNTLTPYKSLYEGTFEEGALYTVTGIYVQFDETKEILPRSAADIVELIAVTVSKDAKGKNYANADRYFATLYYSDKNLKMTGANLNAHPVKVKDGKISNIVTYSSNNGNVIPAGMAVMLEAVNPGTYTFEVVDEYTDPEYNYILSQNMLHGTDEAATTTAPGEGEYKFYALSLNGNDDPGTAGFYFRQGCQNGQAFENGAHKAYLAVPADVAGNAKYFVFGEETDGIRQIENGELTIENAEIYNLSGQRVNKAQKGVYIVNGKKVVIR